MAIDLVIKRRMGRELIEHLVFQARAALLRGASQYNSGMSEAATVEAAGLATEELISSPPTTRAQVVVGIRAKAIESLKLGIDTPHKLRERIKEGVRVYGQQRIIDAFANAGGDMTLAEFNADLTSLETYAQGLVDKRNGGDDWGLLASDIQANIVDKVKEWNFPMPSGYIDIWGE